MALDIIALKAAKKYTDDSMAGAGAVAGVPCQIQSITEITGGNRITFLWEDNDGVEHTDTLDVMDGVDGTDGTDGEDGIGIKGVAINAENNHLIVTFDDDTTADAGEVPTEKGDTGRGIESMAIDASNHLIVTYDDDTTDDAGEVPNVQADFNEDDSTADAYIKNKPTLGTAAAKDYTTNVRPGSHDLVESNAVYAAINSALSSIYEPHGDLECAELTAELLIADNIGNVYNMIDSGTTSALFIQGAGISISANDAVGIIRAGQDSIMYNYMGNVFDLHDYQKKELTTPLTIGGVQQTEVEDALGALNTNEMADVQDVYKVMGQNGAKNYLQILASGTFVGNGITFVVNDDGTVTVSTDENGATGDTNFYLNPATQVWVDPDYPIGDYILSGCPAGGSAGTYRLALSRQGASSVFDTGTGTAFTHASGVKVLALIQIGTGTVLTTPIVFKPMIRLATDTDATYRPYVPTNSQLLGFKDNGILGAKNFALPINSYGTTSVGLVTSTDSDGITTVTGTATTSGGRLNIKSNLFALKKGTYKIVGFPNDATKYLDLVVHDSSNNILGLWSNTSDSPSYSDTFALTADTECFVGMNTETGVAYGTGEYKFGFNIQLATDTDQTYQPYAMTNRELTELTTVSATPNSDYVDNNYVAFVKNGREVVARGYVHVATAADRFATILVLGEAPQAITSSPVYMLAVDNGGNTILLKFDGKALKVEGTNGLPIGGYAIIGSFYI